MPGPKSNAVLPDVGEVTVEAHLTGAGHAKGSHPIPVSREDSSGSLGPAFESLRPELPLPSLWCKNPAKALYKTAAFPMQLLAYPLYKERIIALKQHGSDPDTDEALAVADRVQETIQKEQETVGLVGALLLSICASLFFSPPAAVAGVPAEYSWLRDLYLYGGGIASGCEALAVAVSVILIIILNTGHTDSKYMDLVDFIQNFWVFCALSSMMCASGMSAYSIMVVSYISATYVGGAVGVGVPIVVIIITGACYVTGGAMVLKMMLRGKRVTR